MSRSTLQKVRLWRYEVTEVFGFEDRDVAPVKVGDVLIDRWKPDRCWTVYDIAAGKETGSWVAKLLGEYDGPRDDSGYPVSRRGSGR